MMTGSLMERAAVFATDSLWDRSGFFKMETTNKQNSLAAFSIFCALFLLANSIAKADPVSEMASFSTINNVDLAQLAKTDVKAAHGAPMSTARFLSVQSCYVVPHAPAREIELMRKW